MPKALCVPLHEVFDFGDLADAIVKGDRIQGRLDSARNLIVLKRTQRTALYAQSQCPSTASACIEEPHLTPTANWVSAIGDNTQPDALGQCWRQAVAPRSFWRTM
jgi:hypothetical protein